MKNTLVTAQIPDKGFLSFVSLLYRCKNQIRAGFIVSVLFAITGCGGTGSSTPPLPPEEVSPIPELWSNTVEPFLQADLWLKTYNYDTAHILMGPMHWAFQVSQDSQFEQQFHSYFERYLQNGFLDEENQLRKLQYLYFHSQYLKLYFLKYGRLDAPQVALKQEIMDEFPFHWYQREVVTFGRYPSFQGMRERFYFKLNTIAPNPEVARAIFDEELFIVAIAADMYVVGEDENDLVRDIIDTGFLMYDQETIDAEQGMLFQPGVWSHHPDYIYAGNDFITPDIQPMIIEDIATDSSHMHRWPLWLISMRDAFDELSPERARIEDIFDRLKWQFENKILVPGSDEFPAPRLNNYSDGSNGVYRLNYNQIEDNSGYGPYDVSGTLVYSWYAFLNSDVLRQEFEAINFPFTDDMVKQFVGPDTKRPRHPLLVWPDYFTNGFGELNIRIAVELAKQ